jgi:hypothetical protein
MRSDKIDQDVADDLRDSLDYRERFRVDARRYLCGSSCDRA